MEKPIIIVKALFPALTCRKSRAPRLVLLSASYRKLVGLKLRSYSVGRVPQKVPRLVITARIRWRLR